MITIANANALHIPLRDQSVQCVVTSPPYWGLRDYGMAKWEGGNAECDHSSSRNKQRGTLEGGQPASARDSLAGAEYCRKCGARRIDAQIGLESTPAAYVANIVAVMRECWRVLKDDGVLFLNLGDSYTASGGGAHKDWHKNPGISKSSMRDGVPHEVVYGTSGKAPEDYQDHGCLCGNLCDVCRVVYQSHKSHNDDLLVSMLTASLSETSREHKESQNGHLPTSDSLIPEGHNSNAILDSVHSQDHEHGRLRVVLESMLGESYPRLLGVCLQRANRDECLLCARSLVDYAQGYADKTQVCTCDTAMQEHPLGRNMLGKSSSYVAYPYYTTESLKPKDLCGIPWRVAFALQDDGWYLRQDIIWHKPNPMPESVTDRCTKAHEYVFLLTKRARYYYDAEAIKEDGSENTVRAPKPFGNVKRLNGNGTGNMADGVLYETPSSRNRRSVWTVATSPYSGAHFATFPPALIEPMILAGTSQRGECPHCGKAWVRVTEKGEPILNAWSEKGAADSLGNPVSEKSTLKHIPNISTLGWRPSCACPPHEPIPQTVLDPFAGSGTTGAVAVKHGRRAVLLDLNTKYIDLQFERTNGVQMTMPV